MSTTPVRVTVKSRLAVVSLEEVPKFSKKFAATTANWIALSSSEMVTWVLVDAPNNPPTAFVSTKLKVSSPSIATSFRINRSTFVEVTPGPNVTVPFVWTKSTSLVAVPATTENPTVMLPLMPLKRCSGIETLGALGGESPRSRIVADALAT